MPGSEIPSGSSGPLRAPSSTTWRRQRLLRIGSSGAVNIPSLPLESSTNDATSEESLSTSHVSENTTLQPNNHSRSYGTLPSSRRSLFTKQLTNFRSRRGLSQLPDLTLPHSSSSNPSTPLYSPSAFRDLTFSRLTAQRPISAYDAPLELKDDNADIDADPDAKINGIRVWYSSFSSIDWLHDAIKDSVRFSRLRKRKSIRARIRLAIDKSIGWFIVTIVGFLTAIVAFLVVRSEQWLFDSKEGYCHEAWWKPKRFCCPQLDEGELILANSMRIHAMEEVCPAWRTWAEAFGAVGKNGNAAGGFVQYIAYAVVAVSITLLSCHEQFANYFLFPALSRRDILSSHNLSNKLHNLRDTQRIWRSRS